MVYNSIQWYTIVFNSIQTNKYAVINYDIFVWKKKKFISLQIYKLHNTKFLKEGS